MNPETSTIQNLFSVKSWRSFLQLLIATAILCGGSLARAVQTETWLGAASGTSTWTNKLAWTPQGVSSNGDALIFGSQSQAITVTNFLSPVNNFPTTVVKTGAGGFTNQFGIDSITFNTNGINLSGNALQITNGITDNYGQNSDAIALTLGKAQTFANFSSLIGTNASVFTNTISGTVDLKTNTLTVGGSAPLFLNGVVSSTNGGNLIVNNGGITRLSVSNTFGINTVVITSGITNGLSVVTNFTYYTNVYVVVGVSTNFTYFTNSAVVTNGTWSYGTNVLGPQNRDVVAVQSGTLQLNNNWAIPSGSSGAVVGNLSLDGTLDLNSQNPVINGLEDSSGGNPFIASGVVDNLAGGGLYTLNVGTANSNSVFAGVIGTPTAGGATSGTIGLTKVGYGALTLLNANQYGGPTIINQGKIVVGSGASLGNLSTTLTITSGGELDVPSGYVPVGPLTVAAGTPTKPYTNFLGSFDPYWGTNPSNYVVSISATNTVRTFATNTDLATFTNVVITTNFASYTFTTNSIISIVNADVVGNFTVNGGGAISPITSITPGIATWKINGNLTLDESQTLSRNRVNFLLNETTPTGGGTNDLIAVTGTLTIGGELDFVITPVTGTLAAGTYTLMTSGAPVAQEGTPLLKLVEARGLVGDTVQIAGNNITLTSLGGTAVPGNIVWRGTPTLNNWDVNLSQNWLFNGNPDYFYSLDNATFDDTGVGTIVLPVVLNPGSVTFNNNRTNYTFTQSQATFITGAAGGFVKNGSGTVTLANPNALECDTTVNGGVLALGYYNNSSFGQNVLYNGVPAHDLILGGGTINQVSQNDVGPTTGFQNIVLNPGASSIVQQGRGANELPIYSVSNNVTRVVGGVLNVSLSGKGGSRAGLYFSSTNSPDGTNDFGVNGIVGGYATYNLTDWLYANSANTTAAGAQMGLPAAFYQNDNNSANWVATSNVAVTASASGINTRTINSLKFNAPSSIALNLNSGQTLTLASGGVLIPNSALSYKDSISGGTLLGAPGQDLILLNHNNIPGSSLTIGSVIADNSGATALTTGGPGTTVLAGNNTYTGPTYINAGFVPAAGYSGSATGTLQIGANGTSGSIDTSSAFIDNGILAFFRSDNITFSHTITGTGGLTKLGGNVLTLTANNTLSGLVTVSAGTLQLGNGGASGSVSNAVGIVDNATLVFNNNGNTVGFPNPISGYGSVVQFGSGNLIIATNETYTGNTVVSNGTVTLTASGSISNTAAIVVKSGALLDVSALSGGLTLRSAAPSEVLAGSGTVNGSVATANGTSLTPGANGVFGTLTINNNLTLNGGIFTFDVTNNANALGDLVNVGGTLALNSGSIIINVMGTPLANGVYPLFHYTGGVTGVAANLGLSGFVQPGQIGQLIVDSAHNNLDLLVSGGTITSLTWVGDGANNIWDLNGTANWTAGAGNTTYANPAYTTLSDSGSVSPPVNITVAVSPTAVTNSSANNYVLGANTGSAGKITGGAKLVKSGSGLLTLQTLNDYLGGTFITNGTVQLGNNTAAAEDGMVGGNGPVLLGDSASLVVSNFATETMSGSLQGAGLLTQQGAGKLILAGDNSGFSGPITINTNGSTTNVFLQMGNGVSGTLGTGAVTNNGTVLLDVGPTPVSTVAVAANITGLGGVTNIGPGIVTLTGNNSFTGKLANNTGTVRLGSDTALPSNVGIFMDNNNSPGSVGTLDLNGHNATIGSLQGNNTGQGNSTLVECQIVNNGPGTATLTIGGGTTTTFNGELLDNNNVVGGVLALLVNNNTTLTLNACFNNATVNTYPNAFSGGMTISNASVALGVNTGTPPANEGGASAGPGTITLQGGMGTITNGNTRFPTNGMIYACGYGGSTSPTIGTQIGQVNVPAGQSGVIFGPARGQFACTLTGSGTLIYQPHYVRDRLGGDWTAFTGTIVFEGIETTANAGGGFGIDSTLGYPNATLFMQVSNVNGVSITGTSGGNVFPLGALAGGDNTSFIGGGTQGNGTANGAANTIWAIGGLGLSTTNGSQILDGGCGIRLVGGSLTLTNNVLSFGGQCVVSNGTLALAPLGNYEVIVAGVSTNDYFNAFTNNFLVGSNLTIVSPGILDLSQASNTLYLASLARAQTLFGNGTVKGNLLVSNSVVAPSRRASDTGIYPGQLQVTGSATFNSGSTFRMAANGTGYDSLAAGGGLTINNAALIVVTNGPAVANNTSNVFRFFSAAVPMGATGITNITVPDVPNSYWVTNLTLDGSMALVNTNTSVGPNPYPPTMNISISGNTMTLGWPTNLGWILQSQTNGSNVGLTPTNNWYDVAGSATQTNIVITVNATNPAVFYRMRHPSAPPQ